MVHTIQMEEEERQMTLLALAKLSLERPGWDYAASELALKFDNHGPGGRPVLYDEFRELGRTPETLEGLRQYASGLGQANAETLGLSDPRFVGY